MSTWLVAWFVIGVVTTVALIAFLIALTRHALVVGRAARQMQEAVQPIADEISRQTARQQRKVSEMRTKVPTTGAGRAGRGPGGR